MPEIIVADDLNGLNRTAADRFTRLAAESIASRGRFTVALAGGSTPKALYRLLASEQYKDKIEWSRVFFFFGDERYVPVADEESNYRMARENLLDPIEIPAENVFRWQTETGSPEEVAAKYEEWIKDFFGGDIVPHFDLILLGLGTDGHTASLFPESRALDETTRLAVANPVEQLGVFRLTFTFLLINNAANVIFLVAGKEKATIIPEILGEHPDSGKYPARVVKPIDGNLTWLLDKSASAELTTRN